jgi:hypothetical protein
MTNAVPSERSMRSYIIFTSATGPIRSNKSYVGQFHLICAKSKVELTQRSFSVSS